MALLRLSQLLDAAIAAPDAESVNFRALRNLLQAMLGHLGLQDRSPRGLEQPAERDRARTPAAGQQPQQAGEQLPAKDALQDTAGGSEADVAADVGQPVQRVEGDESSSSEDTAVYQALLEEISQMKEAQSRMQGEIRVIQEALGLGNRQDAAGQLPGLCNPRTLASDVQMLKERLGLYPDPEEVSNMVHWDVLEDCLVGSKGERGRDGGRPRGEQEEEDPSATTKSPTSDVDTPHGASSEPGSRESSAGLKDPGAALTAPEQQAGVPSDRRRDASTRAMMQTASGDVQTTSLGTQPTEPESTGTQTTRLGTQLESTTTQTASLGTQPTEPESRGTQTTRLGTQPESTTTQTASLGTQPTEPESTGTLTTRLGTQLESTTTQTASLGTQPTEPESTGTQTTRLGTQPESTTTQTASLGTQPTEPESTGTQTTRLGTQPESTTTQTASLGTQPTEPESTGTLTTRLGTQLESTTTQTASLGTQPTEPESTGTQTTRLGTQPESTTTQTASLGTQPTEPESTGTQTTRLGTQPESTTTQTASLGTQPTEPESTGTLTTRLGTQLESTTTQTASLGTQPTEPESTGTQTTRLGTQPESTTTQTASLGTQPTEPESTGTLTTRLGTQLESTTTQTATLGTQPESTGTQTTRLGTQLESTTTQTATLGTQPESTGTQTTRLGTQLESTTTQTATLGTQPESTGTQTTRLGTQPESTVAQTTISGEQLSTQLAGAGTLAAGTLLPTAQGLEIPLDADPRATSHVQELALPSGSSSAYHNAYRCYAETVEAVKQIGQLRHLYAALKEQVAQLEASRLERTELEKLRLLLQEAGQESVANTLGDLQAQVSSVQGLARELQGLSRELQGEKGKIRKLESALGKLEAARASWQMDLSDQLSLLSGSTPQEEKRDMKDLSEQQQISKAALDQVVSQTAEGEQEQLEEVRAMESTGQEEAVCPMCSSDTSTRLGKLLRRYEKLQGLVESLMSRKKTGKVVRQLPGKSQDEEVLKRIQAAILQMQGEYEQLNSVTGSLLDDSRQQQKDIEGLLQSVERLEKEKADKEDLELGMDEKADKGALESRVSRAQFEASLELLKERNQEVLSRVTGQEQGLHEVQQQLREEMASKLDRLELGPFQQELEEHWKSSLEQLKEMAPPMEADDAAGIRKQLLVDFQCLSCDRQLSMRVPGSPIPPIPPFPPLVPHVTGRSQPVLKTEQTHREPMAACRYPTVPRQCGGQHTLTGPLQRSLRLPPVQPSTPQALQPSTLLPSKDKVELLGQDSRRAGPCPSAPGTTGPLERRSASSHSHLLQGHQPHPPLQPRRMDAATRQPGRPAGHRLNPIARAPQQARGSSSQQQQ
ncbi:nucleosome-remodeling factor subunit BPTF-like [Lathamus discolor]|uniref:nucleosome-remodeling factor subunit BPTF-like n=1 Tax=Lathamus discolor TaxID=678569 RepID=UPI0032B7F267